MRLKPGQCHVVIKLRSVLFILSPSSGHLGPPRATSGQAGPPEVGLIQFPGPPDVAKGTGRPARPARDQGHKLARRPPDGPESGFRPLSGRARLAWPGATLYVTIGAPGFCHHSNAQLSSIAVPLHHRVDGEKSCVRHKIIVLIHCSA